MIPGGNVLPLKPEALNLSPQDLQAKIWTLPSFFLRQPLRMILWELQRRHRMGEGFWGMGPKNIILAMGRQRVSTIGCLQVLILDILSGNAS